MGPILLPNRLLFVRNLFARLVLRRDLREAYTKAGNLLEKDCIKFIKSEQEKLFTLRSIIEKGKLNIDTKINIRYS